MSDILLKRSMVQVNQRTDFEDFTRANNYALGNLALVMRYALAPTFGVVRGLTVGPTDPAGMSLVVKPGLAICEFAASWASTGLAVVESERTIGPIAANNSGNPRIDLVSIRYDEGTGTPETRPFVNPVDATQFSSLVDTEVIADPIITITQGTPGASPSAPATPAGDIPLATIAVANGATVLDAADCTTVQTNRVDPVRVATWAGGAIGSLPFTAQAVLSCPTPESMRTVLEGQITLDAGLITPGVSLRLQLRDVAAASTVGEGWHSVPTIPNLAMPRLMTMRVQGVVVGPSNGVRDYTLRIERGDGGGTFISAATGAQIVAITG